MIKYETYKFTGSKSVRMRNAMLKFCIMTRHGYFLSILSINSSNESIKPTIDQSWKRDMKSKTEHTTFLLTSKQLSIAQ